MIRYILSLFPVFVILILQFLFFRDIRVKRIFIFISVFYGIVASFLSFIIISLIDFLYSDYEFFYYFFAGLFGLIIKSSLIYVLLNKRFIIDVIGLVYVSLLISLGFSALSNLFFFRYFGAELEFIYLVRSLNNFLIQAIPLISFSTILFVHIKKKKLHFALLLTLFFVLSLLQMLLEELNYFSLVNLILLIIFFVTLIYLIFRVKIFNKNEWFQTNE